MKRILSVIIALSLLISVFIISATLNTSAASHEPFSLSSVDFISQITAGWNLGNTFDAHNRWDKKTVITPNDMETGWGNPTTTKATFEAVRAAGFNATRIPVSWGYWVDDANGYTISKAWLDRVNEVVDYSIDSDLITLINMHHDDRTWFNLSVSDTEWVKVKEKYGAIWTQIANRFKDYGENLMFEGMNEVLAESSPGNYDWWGQSDKYFTRLNELYKIFVDSVRATGGNNAKRYLVVPTYGAQWYEHQWGNVVVPNNDNHVIIDIHWYNNDTKAATFETYMKPLYNKLVSKGQAVIFGETGIQKTAADTKKSSWATAYFGTAKKYGMPVYYWDDGGNYQFLVRSTGKFNSTSMLNAIMAAVGTEAPTLGTTIPRTTGSNPPSTGAIYCDWSMFNFGKTEGWQSGANNLSSIVPDIDDGIVHWNISGFVSQQLNSGFKLDTQQAGAALEQAKAGSGMMSFTITLNKALDGSGKNCSVNIKHNLTGTLIPDNALSLKYGETKTVMLYTDEWTQIPESITFQVQQFDSGLTALDMTISSVTVVEYESTSSPTTTVAPTTATPTTKPMTTVAPTTATPTTKTMTTVAPTTVAPTTKTMTTVAPTTVAPTTKTPTTATPTTKHSFLPGDTDSDGIFNAKDVLLCRKYIAKYKVTLNLDAADVVMDSQINAKDVLLMRKKLAGRKVVFENEK